VQKEEQAILLVSFGVSQPDVRQRCLETLAAEIAAAFPAYTLRQAYTSVFIRRRLADQGIRMPSLPEALEQLQLDGFQRVLVQPTHLTPGEEYENKICRAVEAARHSFAELRLGQPVFFQQGEAGAVNDYRLGLSAMLEGQNLQPGEAMVFMGHGSPHHHNPVYERLQAAADVQGLPVHIGVLEPTDTPSFTDVLSRLQSQGCRQVYLQPLLLTGGRHVAEDMAGAESSSWKSRLEAAGFSVRVSLQGLAERASFRRLYQDHIRRALL